MSASASVYLFVHYLLNGWVDYDQICIDTLLGGGRVDKILVSLTLFSMSHQQFEMSNFDQNSTPAYHFLS